MEEIHAMSAIAEKMESLAEDARARVLSWAASKYGSAAHFPQTFAATAPITQPHASVSPEGQAKVQSAGSTKPKASKKAKSIISMDKSLNLSPAGKQSANDFAKTKSPSNAMQKCVVAIYYLRETIQMPKVTVSAVYTYFKTLSWPVPADLKNILQQAGTKGWLDTKDSDDIKLTSMGENLVEHSLPPKPRA